ncbi:MAG: molybdopterin-dependent oxidoreductase [bacterium]|nr:molybdopterin-dependent oxidoreductase [bacterium]
MSMNTRIVGKAVRKVDGEGLVLGVKKFTDDYDIPGLLVGKLLLSPHAHARIRRIDASRARALRGVHAVLTYADVPRIVHTTAGQGYPEPSPYDTFILDNKVRYVGDRVAAVAAETEEIAEEALSLIEVEYEILPAVLDARAASREGAPVIHDEPEAHVVIPIEYDPKRNIAAHTVIEVGDVERGLEEGEVRVSEEYTAHYAQHCALEPHVTVAYVDEDGRLVLVTSTQVPFHARRIVAQALGLPVKGIRVIKPRIGGGFGSKQEVFLEQICAALCLAAGRPVKIRYTREEEIVSSRTRHEMHIRVTLGAKRDGRLTAIKMDVLSNTGAYGAHGLTVASNAGSKVLPLYRCENVRFEATVVYTNMPVGGAYRGYGATQGAFAMESAVDELAERLGMNPKELRVKLHIRSGETSPIFAKLGEGKPGVAQTISSCKLGECIEVGAAAIDWEKKWEGYRTERAKGGRYKRGVGMAILMQGSSIPHIDMGAATIKMNEDGSFNLLAGATDLGTGSDTILAQIAAEVLGVGASDIIVYTSDTDMTPFDVGAYASSTTYLSGRAVQRAAEEVRRQVIEVGARLSGSKADGAVLEDGQVVFVDGRRVSFEEVARYALYQRDQFQIMGTGSYYSEKSPPPFAAHFAEVEVDRETGEVRVVKYVAAVDCGVEINPVLARGQTEGAVINGIGYALYEEFVFNERGRMVMDTLMRYRIPGTRDIPEVEVIHVPSYEESGPFGAKSVAEISINGPLPAIGNAIYHATGVRLRRGPFTAERVWRALREAGR